MGLCRGLHDAAATTIAADDDDGSGVSVVPTPHWCRCGRIRDADRTATTAFYNCTAADGKPQSTGRLAAGGRRPPPPPPQPLVSCTVTVVGGRRVRARRSRELPPPPSACRDDAARARGTVYGDAPVYKYTNGVFIIIYDNNNNNITRTVILYLRASYASRYTLPLPIPVMITGYDDRVLRRSFDGKRKIRRVSVYAAARSLIPRSRFSSE